MKLIIVLMLLMGSNLALANNSCVSLFSVEQVGNKDAKELFHFLILQVGYPSIAFSHNYMGLIVRQELLFKDRYHVILSQLKNRGELSLAQESLMRAGLRKDHEIFSSNLDISNPAFRANKMNSDNAKELFDFLVLELGYPTLAFKHNFEGIVIGQDINSGKYFVDYSLLNNRGELQNAQAALKEAGFRNSRHPIFN